MCPDGGGQLLVNDWLDEGGSGRPKGAQEGKGRDDLMTAVVQTFAWNIMKPFDFLSAFKFLFLYLYVYIYVYMGVFIYDDQL